MNIINFFILLFVICFFIWIYFKKDLGTKVEVKNMNEDVDESGENIYVGNFICTNCGSAGEANIKKGTLVVDAIIDTVCVDCGCKTLKAKEYSVLEE